jgi:hypothetical protein
MATPFRSSSAPAPEAVVRTLPSSHKAVVERVDIYASSASRILVDIYPLISVCVIVLSATYIDENVEDDEVPPPRPDKGAPEAM